MALPQTTRNAARAIYYYAGGEDELPRFDNLSPAVQMSYIEEAEAAIGEVVKYIKFLASQVDVMTDEDYLVKGTMLALADTIDPNKERNRNARG